MLQIWKMGVMGKVQKCIEGRDKEQTIIFQGMMAISH